MDGLSGGGLTCFSDAGLVVSDNVKPFDPSKRKPAGHAIDLEAPFFSPRTEPVRDYSKCDHTLLGFEYSVQQRKVYCKCGEEVDPFDAIVAMGRSASRMQDAANTIKEERLRKAEEKAKRQFVKSVTSSSLVYDRLRRPYARDYGLECGHTVRQHRGRGFKRHWRSATCTKCFRAAELAKKNIQTVPAS